MTGGHGKGKLRTMSMYDPVLAIARYSPSNEKLRALMALLDKSYGYSYDPRGSLSTTYSQDAIVRAQIHSFKSNMLTIES